MLPDWLKTIIGILVDLIRMLGLLLLGLGAGWLTLEVLRKAEQAWQLQIAVFLGFVALAIGMARYLSPAALGGYGIGVGVALLIWGLPKKPKEEDKEK